MSMPADRAMSQQSGERPPCSRRGRWDGFSTDALHLFVLASFAVAQPLFAVLGKGAEFFVARRADTAEILVFAIVLVVGIPALGVAVEAIAAALGYRARRAVHVLLVAALVTAMLLQATRDLDVLPGDMMILDASLVGLAAAVAYLRWRPIRLTMSVLAPAPVLFVLMFLLASPVAGLVMPRSFQNGDRPKITRPTPIVLVVFDEFASTYLMDERRQIDRDRYPNLAAFAKDATWYRAATTVSDSTVKAVPAVLTGRRPDRSKPRLPTIDDHPRNLFTALAGSYSIVAYESISNLCPERACTRGDAPDGLAGALRGLLSDSLVVLLHITLPADRRSRLPSITQSWADFATEAEADPVVVFRRFVRSLDGTSSSLYFLHVLLPHVPWRYLPSGRAYESRSAAMAMDGWERGPDRWKRDEWAVIQGFQRYLLQVGLVDTLVGELVTRLKAIGLYDEALVVLTADHGVSFQAGRTRRVVLPENAHEIVGVPLFVKLPGQRTGEVSDADVETIDILPTIADVIGLPVHWTIDGRSLLGPPRAPRAEKIVLRSMNGTTVAVDVRLEARWRAHARMLTLFGSGSDRDGLFRIGPYRALVGRSLAAVEARAAIRPVDVRLDEPARWASVVPGSLSVPARITGRLVSPDGSGPWHVAVAMNGTIRAVTRTLGSAGGSVSFSAMVPESALVAGRNEIDVLLVTGTPERPVLTRTHTSAARAGHLLASDTGELVVMPDGTRIPVSTKAVAGWVDVQFTTADRAVVLRGWAVDPRGPALPETVLVFVGSTLAYAGPTHAARDDVAARYGAPHLRQSGFEIDVPLGPANGPARIRAFAVAEGIAWELGYTPALRSLPARWAGHHR